jgi:hypothetical protein
MDEETKLHLINIYTLFLEQTNDSIEIVEKLVEIEKTLKSAIKRVEELENKGTVYWTPGYTSPPKRHSNPYYETIIGDWDLGETTPDGGWTQFLKDYPNACPNCKASDGMVNGQCRYCCYKEKK